MERSHMKLGPPTVARNLDSQFAQSHEDDSPPSMQGISVPSGMRGRGRVEVTASTLVVYMLEKGDPGANTSVKAPNPRHPPPPYVINVSNGKARNRCKGPKQQCGKLIDKGELRMGINRIGKDGKVIGEWRHWSCVTPAALRHLKAQHPTVEEIPGFDILSARYQAQARALYHGDSVDKTPEEILTFEPLSIQQKPAEDQHPGRLVRDAAPQQIPASKAPSEQQESAESLYHGGIAHNAIPQGTPAFEFLSEHPTHARDLHQCGSVDKARPQAKPHGLGISRAEVYAFKHKYSGDSYHTTH
ncbi:hypothetical protein Hypma_004291 [Hypsizygus marmoreus]|uniref:PARP-type domain-containing protein n=1 Tax=Hypsizygus marmoreus TaxID=39966 RepID=A0A369K3R1_HYPMA|nr:hypothetical protein Hypma_004291 [Hypsizygus marmoreus]